MKTSVESLRTRKLLAYEVLGKHLTGVYGEESAVFQRVKMGLKKLTVLELEALAHLVKYSIK